MYLINFKHIEQPELDENYKPLPLREKNIYEKYRSKAHRISAIGYKELFCYFNGDYTLEEAKEKIKRESRRYAKRQMTWFRKEKEYITYNGRF